MAQGLIGFAVEAAAALTFGLCLAYALFGYQEPAGERRFTRRSGPVCRCCLDAIPETATVQLCPPCFRAMRIDQDAPTQLTRCGIHGISVYPPAVTS